MRILLCGVAAIALSGCSWMGFGQGHDHQYGANSYDHGTYKKSNSNDGCCVGGQTLSRWNMEAGIGPEFVVGGTAITGSKANDGFVAPVTNLSDVSMSDAFDTGYRAELGGSYALSPNRKLTGQVFYSEAQGNDVQWGTQAASALRGTMSDYKSYGVEAGIRQYFQPGRMPLVKSVRPYVEGKLGAAHVDAMRMENIREVPGTLYATPTSLAFYEDSWVPTASGVIGIETPVFNRFTMGVETGIRYVGKPKTDNSDVVLPVPGFNGRYAGANNGGDRFTVPVTIRGRYRF